MKIRKFYYGDIPEDAGTGAGSTGAGAGIANVGTGSTSAGASTEPKTSKDWPLWEVFIRSKQGLDHKHMGSLHAADAEMAVENARDVYTRRMEGVSIWVVESKYIHASNPDDAESFYEPANDKVYRHPTFYQLPDELSHM
jgi:ring-1,2-phenylacetyl-CoA epoxidase subunit PaaB